MSDLDKILDFIEGKVGPGNYGYRGELDDGYDGGWGEFSYDIQPSYRNPEADHGIEIPGLGKAKFVEQYGGEGQGEDRWLVFEVNGTLYRKDGWYASYEGTTWDGDLYECIPTSVTITEYRRKQ